MNPYRIEGPALISFSGGRTSAYMLHEIVKAWDGKLPDDIHVCFANTGKEREETLRFVHECGSRWGVRVRWLEWRGRRADGFEEVGFNSASRQGEPFAAVIQDKQWSPSSAQRFCTQELKVRTMERFARSLGWTTWANVIGLRYDEGHRVLKALARNDGDAEVYRSVMPLSKAKVSKVQVMAFWARQTFDLGLRHYEGNCDLCFLKGRGKLMNLIRENPGIADWWIAQERSAKGQFNKEFSYADLAQQVRDQGHLFDGFMDDGEDHDAECGLTCSAEAA